jgi:hypothetical protein
VTELCGVPLQPLACHLRDAVVRSGTGLQPLWSGTSTRNLIGVDTDGQRDRYGWSTWLRPSPPDRRATLDSARAASPEPARCRCDGIAPSGPVVRWPGKDRGGSGLHGGKGVSPCTGSTAGPESTAERAPTRPPPGQPGPQRPAGRHGRRPAPDHYAVSSALPRRSASTTASRSSVSPPPGGRKHLLIPTRVNVAFPLFRSPTEGCPGQSACFQPVGECNALTSFIKVASDLAAVGLKSVSCSDARRSGFLIVNGAWCAVSKAPLARGPGPTTIRTQVNSLSIRRVSEVAGCLSAQMFR